MLLVLLVIFQYNICYQSTFGVGFILELTSSMIVDKNIRCDGILTRVNCSVFSLMSHSLQLGQVFWKAY